MSNFKKFLPALALAVALAPFAAQARSAPATVQNPAHPQILFNVASAQPGTQHGRAGESSPPAGQMIGDGATLYAAGETQTAIN
jgi:hypothetical protein